MNKKIYNTINIVVIAIGLIILAGIMDNMPRMNILDTRYIAIFILGLIIIQVLKCLRIYLILLEEKIPIRRFIKLYIKNTFISLVLPFKTGEIFKVICIGNEISNYKVSLLSVLIDRVFDTYVLVMILVPNEILRYNALTGLTLMLLIFISIVTFLYYIFPSFYKYANQFFILNMNSKQSLHILEICEVMNNIYLYIKELVKGRWGVMIIISSLIWIIEYFVLNVLCKMLGVSFGIDIFRDYLNEAFLINTSGLLGIYIFFNALLFALVMLSVYLGDGVKVNKTQYIKTER